MTTLTSEKIARLLEALYADAANNPPPSREAGPQILSGLSARELYHMMRQVYMAIDADFGQLLYTLVRASGAREIVEFGTSMGVSTIYLACALRDNGGGHLITTEFEAEKIERARKNLSDAGLVDLVEFREGDALDSLKSDLPESIDFVFLDGAKEMYLDVLKRIEPNIRAGGLVASDNTDHDGLDEFLAYLRDTQNGYLHSEFTTTRGDRSSGHAVSMRCGA
ncbi:O-methyltransferase [Aeoliella mucimassa]|uniref:O-methyltransferase/MSMEI_4947 n=1 Tax=Aeoliella mucimassa TaxID=2527972 RepID=A0A518AI81_9BACT|nr:class I SAM-dependent methyltransferase [Aeoliella mucimassa]QDU54439.1 Putative O-methyltransferase/MSMEI_4947 [Aeoliella mucimassa]